MALLYKYYSLRGLDVITRREHSLTADDTKTLVDVYSLEVVYNLYVHCLALQ